MLKKLHILLIIAMICLLIFGAYRLICIRIVNYEIAGMKIPSEYNILTGKVKPITNYSGKDNLPSLQPREADKLGLSKEQVMVAQLHWAIFKEWLKTHPEYKDWETNPGTFEKANEQFKNELKANSKAIVIK